MKQQVRKWTPWIAPGIGTAAVFAVLTIVQEFTFWGAIFLAATIFFAGMALLRSF